MGAAIVLLVWLVVAAMGVGLWLASLFVFVMGRRKRSRLWSWLGGVPLALGTMTALGIAGAAIYGFHWNAQSANIYQMTFGTAPTSDVTALQSSNFAFADSGTTFLRFNAAPATIRALTAKNWRAVDNRNWDNSELVNFRDNGAPDWWNPSKKANSQLWVAHNRFGNFAGEEEVLIYDSISRQAHYGFVGID